MVKTIYIAKVYFTSMTDYKERPVLIIKEYEKNDIIYLPLTTNLKKKGILISNNDLEKGYLVQKSLVIPTKLGILSKKLLIREIGMLKDSSYEKVMKVVCNSFDCKKYS